MNILILNRIPYDKIDYAKGIDHLEHNVFYFGKKEINETIPNNLRCVKIERILEQNLANQICEWAKYNNINFDHVVSLSEYELILAAEIRSKLCVAGKSIDEVLLTRDKILMKACVAKAGLKVPEYYTFEDFLSKNNELDKRTIVVKPVLGASSENICIFHDKDNLINSDKFKNFYSKNIHKFEVEEYVNGTIFHFDGIVSDNCIQSILASKYIGTCLDFANGKPLGSYQTVLKVDHLKWIKLILKSLKIDNGAFHLEAIQSKDGLYFLEVGNRVGGADIVQTFEYASGLHLPSEELKILLSPKIKKNKLSDEDLLISNQRKAWYGWFVYPVHNISSFEIIKDENYKKIRESKYIVKWEELKEIKKLTTSISYQAKDAPLAGIIATNNPNSTRNFIKNLFSLIKIEFNV